MTHICLQLPALGIYSSNISMTTWKGFEVPKSGEEDSMKKEMAEGEEKQMMLQ